MQERLKNYLNRPFPLFLAHRQGRIYFIILIPILACILNTLQPFGLTNWHEYHKGLVLCAYCLIYTGTYAGIYLFFSSFRSQYFNPERWTIGKELLSYLCARNETSEPKTLQKCF